MYLRGSGMDPEILSNPGHLINRIARLGSRWAEVRLQKLGLAVAQVPVFGALKNLGPLSQKELANLLYVEQPTMAQLLARMERDGLIERTPDPKDGRSSRVSLTAKALRKAKPAREVLMEGNRRGLAGFTEEEKRTLGELLGRVLENIEREVRGQVNP
jgi:MarR family transcriptional regulator for hemolysin